VLTKRLKSEVVIETLIELLGADLCGPRAATSPLARRSKSRSAIDKKGYFETARTVSLCFAFEFGDLHGCSDLLENASRSSMMTWQRGVSIERGDLGPHQRWPQHPR
jgi:hypothetical protein